MVETSPSFRHPAAETAGQEARPGSEELSARLSALEQQAADGISAAEASGAEVPPLSTFLRGRGGTLDAASAAISRNQELNVQIYKVKLDLETCAMTERLSEALRTTERQINYGEAAKQLSADEGFDLRYELGLVIGARKDSSTTDSFKKLREKLADTVTSGKKKVYSMTSLVTGHLWTSQIMEFLRQCIRPLKRLNEPMNCSLDTIAAFPAHFPVLT
ncbi:MAG TPA: hypothetical protein VMR45_05330 [Patescibacteria group bacterium]|nr:hypothetical protein [Patescibacteria group bacterium]